MAKQESIAVNIPGLTPEMLLALAAIAPTLLEVDKYNFSHKHSMWGDSASKALTALAEVLTEA